MYKPTLLDKPQILLINKMDTDDSGEKLEKTLTQLNDIEGKAFISLITQMNLGRRYRRKPSTSNLKPCWVAFDRLCH